MPSNQKINVTFDAGILTLQYVDDQSSDIADHYNLSKAVSVDGIKDIDVALRDPLTNRRAVLYPFDSILKVIVELQGIEQTPIEFDVQQVANQPSWTADEAGLNAAVNQIQTWMKESIGGGGSGGGGPVVIAGVSTEAKQDAIINELMKGSDFELTCVKDIVTDVYYVMRVYRLETDGSIVVDYIGPTGAVVVPPNPSDLVVCNPDAALAGILAELVTIRGVLNNIDANTDDLETIATSSLTQLSAINLNTDTLESLINASNVDIAAILTELSAQSTQLATIISNLGAINTSVQTADTNNTTALAGVKSDLVLIISELTDISTDTNHLSQLATINTSIQTADTNNTTALNGVTTELTNIITELQGIGADVAPLEASLTAIEAAISTADTNNTTALNAISTDLSSLITEVQAIGVSVAPLEASLTAIESAIATGNASLATISTNTGNTVTELIAANATLSSIDTRLTGAVQTFNLVDINSVVALPSGIKSGSVRNQGSTNGIVAGIVILPGTTVPIPKIDNNDTYGSISVDGTGTSLLTQYTT